MSQPTCKSTPGGATDNRAELLGIATVIVMLALTSMGGCASSSQGTATDESAAEQTRRLDLAQRVNACAIQRAKFDRATHKHDQIADLYTGLQRTLQALESQSGERPRSIKHHGWSAEWDPASITDERLTIDGNGLRVDAVADGWSDVAEFLRRVDTEFDRHMDLSGASRRSDGHIEFQLAPHRSVASPFSGIAFGPDLFPPVGQRSLQAYADDLCTIGGEDSLAVSIGAPPRASLGPTGSSTRGSWMRTARRSRVARGHAVDLLNALIDYDGVSIQSDGDQVVVDVFRIALSKRFDPAKWLAAQSAEIATDPDDRGPLTPPPVDRYIAWQEGKDGYPADASTSLRTRVSDSRVREARHLYGPAARRGDILAVTNALLERRGQALRASLCALHAYSAAAGPSPATDHHAMRVAHVQFDVPQQPSPLDIDEFRLAYDGDAHWRVSAKQEGPLAAGEQAFSGCMGLPHGAAGQDTNGKPHQWSGQAAPEGMGFFSPLATNSAPPRFTDGAEFMRTLDDDYAELRRHLKQLKEQWQRSPASRRLEHLVSPEPRMASLLGQFGDLSGRYDVNITDIAARPVGAAGWENLEPRVVELDAHARPAKLLAFIAGLFDLERLVVPVDLTIQPTTDGHRLQVHAQLMALMTG